jgi:hypothetical protein
MSFRSLNGLNNSVRSLNGLEGVGIDKILSGDAINVVDTTINNKTINVDISKQGATSSLADTDIILLETSGGLLKKITGANVKTGTFSSNWNRSSGYIKPITTSDKILGNNGIYNDSSATATYLDILSFNNTNTSSDLSTFKLQIKDAGTGSGSLAIMKMVHYNPDTDTTTDIYEMDKDSILTISKRLTLTNGLKQGSYDYTMPSSSGTLALQSELDDNWTRSSGNIYPTNAGDTILANDKIEIDTIADATYLDSLILKNTNSGTDILTYSFQIKDAGSGTAPDFGGRLNFEVVYTKGGGTTNNVFEVLNEGFMIIKKRLQIDAGFISLAGNEFDFPSSGGKLLANAAGTLSATSPLNI